MQSKWRRMPPHMLTDVPIEIGRERMDNRAEQLDRDD
jgi:hypothetical protein